MNLIVLYKMLLYWFRININQKLVFVSIIAIVTVFATSAIEIGLGNNMAFARQGCQQPGGVVAACVNANVAKNNICVGVISTNDRCTQYTN